MNPCQFLLLQKMLILSRNQNSRRRLRMQVQATGEVKQGPSSSNSSTDEPHLITQANLKDFVRDLDLLKSKAEVLGSRLQQCNLLEKLAKELIFRKRQSQFSSFFAKDDNV